MRGASSRGGPTCDALVTSGGVSVGDLDLVKVVLEKLSAGTMRWMQVAIRPAKPLRLRDAGRTGIPVFGLPGNPVSAMVSFELFVRPALRHLGGLTARSTGRWCAPSPTSDLSPPTGREAPLPPGPRGRLGRRRTCSVRPSGGQESHHLHAMAEANALAVLPDGDGVTAGGRVDVLSSTPTRRRPRSVVTAPPGARHSVRALGRATPAGGPRHGRRGRADRGSTPELPLRDACRPGPAGRPLRAGPRRPAHLGHRPLQPPLRLLHARGGHAVPSAPGAPHLRRDRPGGPGGPRPGCRRRCGSPAASRSCGGASPTSSGCLAEIGFDDLAMTTNGTGLAAAGRPSWRRPGCAGSTSAATRCARDRFAAIRRRGDLAAVLDAMDAAEAAGLAPLKVNVVLIARRERRRDPRLRRLRPRGPGGSCASSSSCRSTPRGSGSRDRRRARDRSSRAEIAPVWPLEPVAGARDARRRPSGSASPTGTGRSA